MLGESFQHVVVVAENFHSEFGLGAFEHFVETHLDRLRGKDVIVRIHLREHRSDLLVQFGLGARTAGGLGPLVERLIENVNIALVRRHRIGGNVAGANAGKHASDFRKLGQEPVFDFDVGAALALRGGHFGAIEVEFGIVFQHVCDKRIERDGWRIGGCRRRFRCVGNMKHADSGRHGGGQPARAGTLKRQ